MLVLTAVPLSAVKLLCPQLCGRGDGACLCCSSRCRPQHKHPLLLSPKQSRLEELHRLWDLLLQKTKEKGLRLLQAQKLVQYLRECEDALDWISDKVGCSIGPCLALTVDATFA